MFADSFDYIHFTHPYRCYDSPSDGILVTCASFMWDVFEIETVVSKRWRGTEYKDWWYATTDGIVIYSNNVH